MRSACSRHNLSISSAGVLIFAMRCYISMGHGRHANMGFMGQLQKATADFPFRKAITDSATGTHQHLRIYDEKMI